MNDDDLKKSGLAAMIPGMQQAVNHLQRELDRMREQLNGYHLGDQVAAEAPRVKRGRPRKEIVAEPVKLKGGWSADPEERKREMARRMAARDRGASANKMSQAQKANWATLSPRRRKERLAKMLAARMANKKKLPSARLAATA